MLKFKDDAEARDWSVFLASTNVDGGSYDQGLADEMLEVQREQTPASPLVELEQDMIIAATAWERGRSTGAPYEKAATRLADAVRVLAIARAGRAP